MSARPILLIVDDEERILNALSRSLRREGYTILTAQTAERVRELLEQHPVDVVLTDHKMPTTSGLEILSLASQLRPDAARLLISGWPEQVPPDRLADLGVRELLPKPWDDGELKRVLRSAVED
ncbi:MAG: response regulator [Myxococcota bacterium]|nr:response regulator [Myxococcota bacterium]